MAVKRPVRAVLALSAGLVAAIGYEAFGVHRAQAFNRAAQGQQLTETLAGNGAHVRFAQAHALQREAEYEAAMKAYGEVGAPAGSELEAAVLYNLANLYLQRADALAAGEANDLTIPLIELAKENYRELLRRDSRAWDAKYNLELALSVLPELEDVPPADEFMPERSTRAVTEVRGYRKLP